MLNRLTNPFRRNKQKPEFTNEQQNQYYELKRQGLEQILGEMHGLVGHAIIPFQVGGAVDMYYFPHALDGTGFVTMELIEPDGSGPKPSKIGTYELVAFTKHMIDGAIDQYKVLPSQPPDSDTDPEREAFQRIERRICGIFTVVGRYSFEAVLNPLETVEVPVSDEEPNRCLILDEYKTQMGGFRIGKHKHGLLLVIEVHRSEMEYAMKFGSRVVLEKLKQKGYYPYSDLERPSVV